MARVKKPVVFLDRDGTVIDEKGYLRKASHMVFYKTAAPALRLLTQAGYSLVIITNQSAVSRGYITLQQLNGIHAHFRRYLKKRGVPIAGIYFCPHLSDAGCRCRKPSPYLAFKAARDLKLDLKKSFMLGDQLRDVELGRAVGATPILLRTGWGRTSLRKLTGAKPVIKSNLLSAAKWILARDK